LPDHGRGGGGGAVGGADRGATLPDRQFQTAAGGGEGFDDRAADAGCGFAVIRQCIEA
jgi:hypothetical protein